MAVTFDEPRSMATMKSFISAMAYVCVYSVRLKGLFLVAVAVEAF